MLEHGGKLREAAGRYNIPLEDWLDLSTGINPNGWPVPPTPSTSWARLPEDDDGLVAMAKVYYGAKHILPIAGSQAAIQALPKIMQIKKDAKIGVLHPGYGEHAHAWLQNGFDVVLMDAGDIDGKIETLQTLILINPNNPTGVRFEVEQLLDWHNHLAQRDGWLIVDEAFMDPTPKLSLCKFASKPGLIVLRSLGKFFGLAGARVGFVTAEPDLLSTLHNQLGPWTVNGPARWVAQAALADYGWQDAMHDRLVVESARLRALLTTHGLTPQGGTALFQWVMHQDALDIYGALARQGILTRHFTEPASLRFGLPGTEDEWVRLQTALDKINAPQTR